MLRDPELLEENWYPALRPALLFVTVLSTTESNFLVQR